VADSLADWLALREAVDHASRSAALTRAVSDALPSARPLCIVDLGSGTGSNVRYLAPRLPSPQHWLLVDRDASLMEQAKHATRLVETRTMDLGAFDGSIVAGAHLVTASALLDLVSGRWLRRLAAACRELRALALFALTYNGGSHCAPVEPEDDHIRELFNRHQRTNDKGFGTAAGPDAVELASAAFGDAGYRVHVEASDWHLTSDLRALQAALINGWAEAAAELEPSRASTIESWRLRRLAHVNAGRSTIVVSHDDIAATPIE
jgi:hypothetical protein